ncbi:MOLPALP family lipoprotein [Mycoplasma putrefaciens]|uniref:Lipoprotein n=1 Tax=Mycoplasma putrefaciens (strain ATCC 15718 / NCTC 10155 / C30 KS-1 / KS-1) TaxID=743965 RepID=A0A7U4E9B9_MYCPK|nr:MOLPALP family lipoprotein [Mycoplasma putrefaciens]AEM68697.1 lipoprotein [Mycoplasma putrefaciens KS1]
MKKMLSVLAAASLVSSSLGTISCTYTKKITHDVLDQIKIYMNVSSIAAQSILLSDQENGSISTDYSLQTFAQTKLKDLYQKDALQLMKKYVKSKDEQEKDPLDLTYELQFKSMFGDLSFKNWTSVLRNTLHPERNPVKDLNVNWNEQTRTTSNSLISILSIVSGVVSLLLGDDFNSQQQGRLISDFISKPGQLAATVFNNDLDFSDLIKTLNAFTDKNNDNKKYSKILSLLDKITSEPEWFKDIKLESKVSEILEKASKKFWESVKTYLDKSKDKDWEIIAQAGADLLKAIAVYQKAIEVNEDSEKDFPLKQKSARRIFKKDKDNSEFLKLVLDQKLSNVYKQKDLNTLKQTINSLNIKSFLKFLIDRLNSKNDEHGYNFQKVVLLIFGSPEANDIKKSPVMKEFYQGLETGDLVGKILKQFIPNLPSGFDDFLKVFFKNTLTDLVSALQEDLTDQATGKKFSKKLNESKLTDFIRHISTFFGSVGRSIAVFLTSKGWNEFEQNPYKAIYNGEDFFPAIYQLVNDTSQSSEDIIPVNIHSNIKNLRSFLNQPLDKLLTFIANKISNNKGFDTLQFLYGLRSKSIYEIIVDLGKEFQVDKQDDLYIINLLNINALINRIFDDKISLKFKTTKTADSKEKELETKNNLATILTLLSLTEANSKEIKLEIKDNSNYKSAKNSIEAAIKNKQYTVAASILLGFDPNSDGSKFVEGSILEAFSWLFGQNTKDINPIASKNATKALVQAYINLVNWFQSVSIAEYAKDFLDDYLDQKNWKVEFDRYIGQLSEINKDFEIIYNLSRKQNKYQVTISRSKNINGTWRFKEIKKISDK